MGKESEPVTGGPRLLIALERHGAGSLHEQLEQRLRELIRSGRLAPGARMPSSRALASELGISRGVVLESYAQLVAEGYLTASQGAPTRVALTPSTEAPPAAATASEPRYRYDLDAGIGDLASFPRAEWLRSLRAVGRAAPFAALGRGDPRGAPEPRNELSGYLGRVRGAAPEPEHMLVCGGFTQAFALLCRLLVERGVERIAVEAPGWAVHRLVAEAAGIEVVPVPVDERGIAVDALAAVEDCEVVVVTPAHQFPTGVVLSPERRAQLLEWAEDGDALIVEDDYDSELRYDREPVGALQGLAPERVCQIGSLSKRLAPGLRLGWMLSPSWLTGGLTYAQGVTGAVPPVLEQLALAELIARGELDRHLRRMRLLYRDRRSALAAAVARELPRARLLGVPAGLFAVAVVACSLSPALVVTRAAAMGVGLETVEAGGDGEVAVLLGYGNVGEAAIGRAVALLADVLADREPPVAPALRDDRLTD
jgi:GntR family transcriptional regulator / MocR family aminotransferase